MKYEFTVNGAFPSFSVAEVTGRGELAGGASFRGLDRETATGTVFIRWM
jgi:hypothetical protein